MKTMKIFPTMALLTGVTALLCALAAVSGCGKTEDNSAPGAPTDTAKIQAEGAKNAAGQAAHYQQQQQQGGAQVPAPAPPGPR